MAGRLADLEAVLDFLGKHRALNGRFGLLGSRALWRLGISTDNASPAEIKGATGTARAALVQVLSVEVGEARAGPLLIIAHDADLKQAEGLLGRDFLERFTVTIDAKERVVTLVPK